MQKKPNIAFIGAKGIPAIGGAARVCESIIDYLKKDYEIVVYVGNRQFESRY